MSIQLIRRWPQVKGHARSSYSYRVFFLGGGRLAYHSITTAAPHSADCDIVALFLQVVPQVQLLFPSGSEVFPKLVTVKKDGFASGIQLKTNSLFG